MTGGTTKSSTPYGICDANYEDDPKSLVMPMEWIVDNSRRNTSPLLIRGGRYWLMIRNCSVGILGISTCQAAVSVTCQKVEGAVAE
jgi:hypothetical protein